MQMGVVSAWGDSWAAPTLAIPFVSESFTREIEKIPYDVLEAKAGRRQADAGVVRVAGDMVCVLDYENFTSILKAVMGSESGGVVSFADSLDEIRRFQIDKITSRWRLGSVKLHRMVIESRAVPGEARVTFSGIAQDFARSGSAKETLSLSG